MLTTLVHPCVRPFAGIAPACPTNVVQFAASNAKCSSNVAWNATAPVGGDGSKICVRTDKDGNLQFGTIYNINGRATCNIWGPVDTTVNTWQKMCMKVNRPSSVVHIVHSKLGWRALPGSQLHPLQTR
jgi:hypothetical protein